MDGDFPERLARTLTAHPPGRVSLPDARDAAVLVPIVGGPRPMLLFTLRTDTLPSHKGQISFPGGSVDADDPTHAAAALREAREEIGLDPGRVRVLGELDAVPTFVSGYVVHPVVGWLDRPAPLEPNPGEVAAVLEIPLVDLVEEIRSEPGFTHGGRTFPTEAWIWRDNVIWGVTARILRGLLSRLADAGLAPAPGSTASWGAWPVAGDAAGR